MICESERKNRPPSEEAGFLKQIDRLDQGKVKAAREQGKLAARSRDTSRNSRHCSLSPVDLEPVGAGWVLTVGLNSVRLDPYTGLRRRDA